MSPICPKCGLPYATEADVEEAHTSWMNGEGICWYGPGSAYSPQECRNVPQDLTTCFRCKRKLKRGERVYEVVKGKTILWRTHDPRCPRKRR